MNTVVEKITPTMASKYLEMNTHNRPIRQTHVDFLANEIKNDRWVLNGATIVFDGDTLVDGQHRMWAVVTAGKPIQTLVARGVDMDCFPTIDTGQNRSAGDVLSIAGNKNANHLSSAARFAMKLQRGFPHMKDKISNGCVLNFVKENPKLPDSVGYILSVSGAKIFSLSMASALHFLMSKKDIHLADELFRGIYKGFLPDSGETFLALREKLISCATATIKPRSQLTAAYIIKAWNAKRNGSRLKQFKFSPENEDFPKIK